MPFMRINGLKIYYEVHGNGEAVVLLHHGFGCSKMWKDIAPGLVEKGYRVVMYDRRGYGRSEEGDNFEDFYTGSSFRSEMVKELQTLLDRLHVTKSHLIGHCEGGVIGVDFASAFPDRVLSLVMSSTLCFSQIPMEEFNQEKFVPFEELEEDLRAKLTDWHGDKAKRRYELFSRYGGAYGRGIFDLRKDLSRVTCPTLVIYPDRSFLFDVEQGVLLYKNLPKGELCVFPRCGHNTYEQRPQEYLYQVTKFYERLKSG